jgi:hypothetical protein
MFLEVGTNIGTVAARFASEGVPVLTLEANPTNYVRVMAWQCLNHFERPFVAVNQAINTDDNGPGLYMRGWGGGCQCGWVAGSYTGALKEMPGLVQVPPVTVNSLAYGKDSMANQDYQRLEAT